MDMSPCFNFNAMESPETPKYKNVDVMPVRPKENTKKVEKKKESQRRKPDDDDDERRKSILEEKLEGFVGSEAASISFPSSLTSFERRCVHELAEKLGLFHESRGEGKERFIIVARQAADISIDVDNSVSTPVTSSSEPEVKRVEASVKSKVEPVPVATNERSSKGLLSKAETCKNCGKDVPLKNIQLHELRCTKSKDKTRKDKEKKDTASAAQPDFDDLLENFTQKDNVCGFPRCKVKITLFVEQCRFCKKKFCLSHNIPEVHGCGQHARNHARQQIHQGKEHTDANKRAQLQKKLNKKLTSMEEKRKGKKPDKS